MVSMPVSESFDSLLLMFISVHEIGIKTTLTIMGQSVIYHNETGRMLGET